MKKGSLLSTLIVWAFVYAHATTCTWTGAAGDNSWHNSGNWDCGSAPTSSDDVVFPNSATVTIGSSTNVNSITANDYLSLTSTSATAILTINTINYALATNGFVSAAITGFKSVAISSLTLNGPNANLLVLTVQNAAINGAVNTNSQRLKLTGNPTINSSASFSGGSSTGNGIEFNGTSLNINSAITFNCYVQFVNGNYQGSGSITINNSSALFSSVSFSVPININQSNNTLLPISCWGVTFNNAVTLNATQGSIYFSVFGFNENIFKSQLNSNKSFSIQLGTESGSVKFDGATLNINGSSDRMLVNCTATIINTTFNDDVALLHNTVFYSGTFNKGLEIGTSSFPSRTFRIASGSTKKMLGITTISNTVDWEADNIGVTNTTSILINSSGTLNITGEGTELAPIDANAALANLINDGNILCSIPNDGNCNFSLRTNNRNGTITVGAGSLNLPSAEINGTVNILSNGWFMIGTSTYNHTNYIHSTAIFSGSGNLAFGLGNTQINQNFNLGSLTLYLLNQAYLSGSGSLTVANGGNMYWADAWVTIPLTINGTLYLQYFDPSTHRLTNTLTNNNEVYWTNGIFAFNNGTFQNNGTLYINSYDDMSDESGTNKLINCGNIINQSSSVYILVPYESCNTSSQGIIKGTNTINWGMPFTTSDIISPGNSPGTLTINPSVIATTNTVFDMEITGNQADQLASVGNIAINGTLLLRLTTPESGNYTIIDGTSLTGNFTSIQYSLDGSAFSSTLPSWLSISYDNAQGTVTISISAVLPVELLSFKVQHTEGGNVLTWQTTHEVNTSHFDLERSTDGQTFEKIGEIKAQGKATNYQFTDTAPLSTTTYYRLKIMDTDGTSDYSKIVSVSRQDKTKIKVYPNPTKDVLTIDWGNEAPTTIRLLDVLGKVLLYKTEQTGTTTLDLSAVTEGVYFVEVVTKGQSWREKIVKQ